jgi:hypothetical protein
MCCCTAALPARAQQADTRGVSGMLMIGARTVVGDAPAFPAYGARDERYNYLLPYILYAAQKNGVDPYLLLTVCDIETSFQPGATSSAGAQGLTQLMPDTAARFGVKNPYDFMQALDGGAKYLRFLTGLFEGQLDLILAGYNSGEGNVIKYGRRVPPFTETQGYVTRGRATYLRYLQARFPTLNLVQLAGNVRPTSYVQSRPLSASVASLVVGDQPQDEPLPATRSLVYGEAPALPADNAKEKKQSSPAPVRATRSIKFQ